ncbi:hypothetical protein GCM10011375_24420 [Hymenobacter qilianensis]|uniref:Uncharacterized protein n=2 Tax=Hymenobacter qilianensis TaxID=1385715 RepID=A0ACB5PSX3_9BACT|nr:hypothetical protein [Hymenobacter qilianensis]QNP52532.1 hypothetical protein H9L05_01780 [Hymenobacter qilianensis]GGF68514.1 hypothetical protein GCM10011375_24420 [Hymenobacter qilianensis]
MKNILLSTLLGAASLVLVPLTAAAQQTQEPVSSTKPVSAVERDLRRFSDWVSEKVTRAEEGARREWPSVMADYDRQSARLDRATDSLSVQSRREYAAQKARYQTWAAEQQRLDSAARQPETVAQVQSRLLGENVNINRARATELPGLYARLLETTHDQRRRWTAAEWSQASAVLSRLNARYEEVRTQLPTKDRLDVRSWQAEFRTLEKARDVKEIIDNR